MAGREWRRTIGLALRLAIGIAIAPGRVGGSEWRSVGGVARGVVASVVGIG